MSKLSWRILNKLSQGYITCYKDKLAPKKIARFDICVCLNKCKYNKNPPPSTARLLKNPKIFELNFH